YEPEGGYDASQSLVGVSEGETRVRAENSFVFNKDIDAGIRVYKTEEESGKPLQGIEFTVYNVTGQAIGEVPTEEELETYAVADNLAGTITTDSTGYGALELPHGSYLVVEEPHENIKKPVAPFYVTLPHEDEDIAEFHLVNKAKEEPGTVSVEFEVTKAFENWDKAQSFTFELAAVTDGAPMPKENTATSTETEPTAVFASILFGEPGTYEYTITEVNDGLDGITYDTTPHKVTVEVTEKTEISEEDDYLLTSYSLQANVLYDDEENLVITNTFSPATAQIEVIKLLEGRDWQENDSFTVILNAVTEGAPMPENTELTLTKDAQSGTFDTIEFDKAGIYNYSVQEIAGDEERMDYDPEPHSVIIVVSKAEDSTNALHASVEYRDGETVKIVNTKTQPNPTEAQITVSKILKGRSWQENDSFTVTLSALTDDAPLPEDTALSLTKDAQKGSFGTITFEAPGTYEYLVREVAGNEEKMSYDAAEHLVTIVVTDDGDESLNAEVRYEKGDCVEIINSTIVDTGDHGNTMMWAFITCEVIIALTAVVILKKKQLLKSRV
ncbi:MAG: hypothetical protein IKH73_03170, partial [Erysipelotrichaceae bacterium]|nr:hypothetical protein [Erysipelotrichaceae bacterium]